MASQFPPMAKREKVGFHHFPSPPGQETSIRKVGSADHKPNTRYSRRVFRAYMAGSYWRKRTEFGSDQPEMVEFLVRNWTRELGGGLVKGLWAWSGARITERVVMRLDRSNHRPADR